MKEIALVGVKDFVLQAYVVQHVVSVEIMKAMLVDKSKYIPIFFGVNSKKVTIIDLCHYLIVRGKSPIIVYPEKNKKLTITDMVKLHNDGVLFVANAKIYNGETIRNDEAISKFLIRTGLANLIGFAPTKENYTKYHAQIMLEISDIYGKETCNTLCMVNPLKIRAEETIYLQEMAIPTPPSEKITIWQRLLTFLGG